MNHIKNFLNRCAECPAKPKISVVGDVMMDEYFYVDASRVSPEFPIPVMRSLISEPQVRVPGGAGNVCSQFENFPFDVKLYGLIDRDCALALDCAGINRQSVTLTRPAEKVPRKRRFYQQQFPLCRWDVEEELYGVAGNEIRGKQIEIQKSFVSDMEVFGGSDVVVFSDYDKGVFSELEPGLQTPHWFDENVRGNSISIVDPKNGPLRKWMGCDVFKPNMKEAEELSGHKDWEYQCKFFQAQLGCQAVIITQGGDGVVGTVSDQPFEYRPTTKVYPDSVIGAGDCFVAFLAMGLAISMDIKHVVEVAYEAGAIYVQRKHNESVTPLELLSRADPESAKIVMPPKDRNHKLVFTNGCFDILHEGHLSTLRRARSLGDQLVVAVNTDESIKRLKGEDRPIIGLDERMRMLAGLECVDYVVSFSEDTPYEMIKEIEPDVLVKGQDWEGNIVGSDIVPEVHALPLLDGLSTSDIISKIKSEAPSVAAEPIKPLSVNVDMAGIAALPGMADQMKDNPELKKVLEGIPEFIDLSDAKIPSVIGDMNLHNEVDLDNIVVPDEIDLGDIAVPDDFNPSYPEKGKE